MNWILSIAIGVTTLTSLYLVVRYRSMRLECVAPVPVVTFMAILFTSGLDVGLLMFPMVDFEIFANEPDYAFANPLALEFGFWGFLVWGFYFLTTFYFCVVEPKLQLFEIPAVKLVNNLTIIGTCAFTGYLFFTLFAWINRRHLEYGALYTGGIDGAGGGDFQYPDPFCEAPEFVLKRSVLCVDCRIFFRVRHGRIRACRNDRPVGRVLWAASPVCVADQ